MSCLPLPQGGHEPSLVRYGSFRHRVLDLLPDRGGKRIGAGKRISDREAEVLFPRKGNDSKKEPVSAFFKANTGSILIRWTSNEKEDMRCLYNDSTASNVPEL
jgi:hypothetical protein